MEAGITTACTPGHTKFCNLRALAAACFHATSLRDPKYDAPDLLPSVFSYPYHHLPYFSGGNSANWEVLCTGKEKPGFQIFETNAKLHLLESKKAYG